MITSIAFIVWFFWVWWMFEGREIPKFPTLPKINLKLKLWKPKFPHIVKRLRCWRAGHKEWYKMGNTKGCTYCGWSTARYKRSQVV